MEWVKGAPTEYGLYILEWASTGGLDIFVIHNRKGELYASPTDRMSKSKGGKLKSWSISRHLRVPQPEAWPIFCPDLNGAQIYEKYQDLEKVFNLETGTYGGKPPLTPAEALAHWKELAVAFGQPMSLEQEIEFLKSCEEE